jgi:thiol-disulfide isomerase/thioredoxin
METEHDKVLGRGSLIVSLVLVLVVGTTAGVVAWPRLARSVGTTAAPKPPAPAYKAGDTVDVPAAWYAETPYTLVLFGQSTCGACQRAQPYLKQLVAHLEGRAAIVLATPGANLHRDAEVRYARSIGLDQSHVVEATRTLKATVTPTLLVVNQRGEVLGAWEGVGPEDTHEALTRAIDRAIDR